jgi:hypothetical protein
VGVGSVNSNININTMLSALLSSRQKNIADSLLSTSRQKIRDEFLNQQNIANIISSLQGFHGNKQTPVVIIGVDRFGQVKDFGDGRGKSHSNGFDQSHRDRSFDSFGGMDRGFISKHKQDTKDVNLNIVVKKDRPIDKPFPIKGPHADRRGEFRSFNNNDLNLLEFKQPGLQIPQHHNFNKNNIGSNGPAAFSLKDKHKTLGGPLESGAYWKDSLSGAHLKPIPKHLAQQQLANFIQGTNRGDMWKHMGGNKGMALSEYTGKSPGFVPAGLFNGNPETQLQHTRQIIAFPKTQDHTSHPIFKVNKHR